MVGWVDEWVEGRAGWHAPGLHRPGFLCPPPALICALSGSVSSLFWEEKGLVREVQAACRQLKKKTGCGCEREGRIVEPFFLSSSSSSSSEEEEEEGKKGTGLSLSFAFTGPALYSHP